MSQLRALPGRVRTWLRTLKPAVSLPAALRLGGPPARDLSSEFDRFLHIGERLERGLEELKDLQWEIRENEARYRDLLDNQADVIVRRDADGRLTFVNQAFCRVFGLERSEVLGRTFVPRVLDGETVSPLVPGGALRQQRYTQEIKTADGSRWFEWEEHVAPAAGGASSSEVQCLGRDVTKWRQGEAELMEARKQAEAASGAKSRFLAAMSHEIRTPMNGILGMTALLRDTELVPEQQTYAHAIERSARTLLSLIDEILDFSKIEADKLQLNSAPLALDECVQGVVELLAPKAYEKGIDIAWSIDPSLPRLLLGDEVRVRQITTNLVGNAIKFTDTGGVLVTVAGSRALKRPVAPDDFGIAITVQDSGIGIAAETMPALFSEFEQADAAVHRRQGGTGLGLAISRRLARAMGGDILVESDPDRGSTFTATLRFRRAAEADAPIAEPAPPLAVARHVLLALDRPGERLALRLTLEGAFIPLEESTIAAAPDMVTAAATAEAPFTTLIVDGRSGCGTASELLTRAREAAPASVVQGIVVLDTAAKSDFAQFRDAGFDSYLVRPVRPRSVLTLVAGLPASDAPPVAVSAQPQASRIDRTTPLQVLLVEDNDINALLARRMLEKAGCEVRPAVNGREAVDAVRRVLAGTDAAYDLVLMDSHMPVLDGLEATRQIKRLYAEQGDRSLRSPPIIAVTANAFEEDRRRCLAAGMDDYLAKPFDREGLLRVLNHWCPAEKSASAA